MNPPLSAHPTIWERIVHFFKDSEVIFFARLQMFVAAALAVLATMNLSPLVKEGGPTRNDWILYGILFTQGLVTEYARRRREDGM